MRRRVVITGTGVITPLGDRPEQLFDALVAGRSGVGRITSFDASTFATQIAAEVCDFALERYVPDASPWQSAGFNSTFAAAAARLALGDAGLWGTTSHDPTRFGIYLGIGEGPQDYERLLPLVADSYRPQRRELDGGQFVQEGLRRYHAGREQAQELHTPTGLIAEHFGLEGPNYSCLTACAAGSQALGEAADLIRRGDAELMLAGGSHSMIHPFGVTGFNLLTALSTRNDQPPGASRPFDFRRDGFVLGEGAAVLVLEELEHARRRGATIYAELTGYGSTADAFRMTDSHPEGRGAAACMREALADAGLSPGDIDYINAHGTSTQVNDRVETLAIKTVFGPAAYEVPISSTKSMLGHMIGAAGAVELVVGVMTLRRGIIHPTINYEHPDPACDLDYVPNVAREQAVRHVLSNSFGFGGQNITLIVSRFEE